jgi:hypothetical protein
MTNPKTPTASELMTVASRLAEAATNLLDARARQMVTADEWDALAAALKVTTGEQIEWRTQDEIDEVEAR